MIRERARERREEEIATQSERQASKRNKPTRTDLEETRD
jgi:hypothetical protein